ncbi:phage tail tip fiber protein [Pseudomonas putida]|uniref:phage tail tip fiber protein n=6 Tax=Gammaproteobacteria TaxID=1236 RepID=UPI003AF39986
MSLQRVGTTSVDVVGIYAGAYLARVRAVSAFDITSIWKSSVLTQLNGKEGLPPAVTFLDTESLLFGIGIKWGFPAGAEDTQRTELWYSEGTELGLATKLADLSYPQNEYVMQGLRAGQRFYFWARLVDRSGNIGPFFPVEGSLVSGMASADASAILEQIKDQITESELGQELTKRIDLIDMNGPGSVNERLGEVRSDLNQQLADTNNAVAEVDSALTAAKDSLTEAQAALSEALTEAQSDLQEQIDQIADLADSMPYKPDQAYTAGQGVLGEDGKLYQAKGDVPAGNPPPNATYWTDIGQAVQTANGLAVRVQTVETKVQTLEGTTTAQAQQITGLQSSLTTTNGNVTSAQQAAQAASDLAGSKGKVIVQATAPAAADRIAQNLWIDTTGNANTPKRWNGSAWVAVTDKVASDAAAAAANALAVAQTKADANAVQSLTTRVTNVEGVTTAQGQSLTGLQSSLTTTNQNVSAAQAAADAANTLAGGKGKVIVQSAAPAVADRLAQNLWIDTTGSANTPKRWNGSAWVAVTDKVATDAAAAAANALAVAQTKADVSAVQSLTTKVTDVEGVVTAQGQSLTGLQSSLTTTNQNATAAQQAAQDAAALAGGKGKVIVQSAAPAVADRLAQNLWIDTTNNANTPKRWSGSAWVVVTDKVATDAAAAAANALAVAQTKADASAVQSLTTRVADVEGTVTAQGQSLVSLQSSLTTTNQNVTAAQQAAQAAATAAGGKGEVIYGTAAPAADKRLAQNLWIDTTGNANTPKRWNGSAWVAVTDKVATDAAAAAANALSVAQTKADASAVQSLTSRVTDAEGTLSSQGQAITGLSSSLTTTNQNVTAAQQAAQAASDAAGAKGKVLYQSTTPAVADRLTQNLWIDTTSNANTPKRWNGSAWVAVTDKVATDAASAAASALSQVATKADASAVTALNTRMTNAEGKLDTQATSITNLTSSIKAANSAGGNTIPNASFDPAYTQMGMTVFATADASVPAGCPFKYAARLATRDHYPALVDVPFSAVKPGDVWRLSALVACGTGTAPFNLYIQVGTDPATILRTGTGGGQVAATASWTRTSWDYTVPAGVYFIRPFLQIEQAAGGGTVWYATDWHMEDITVAKGAQATADTTASAVTALTTRVASAEGKVASQATSITNLQTSLTTTNNNVTAAQDAAQAASDLAGGKGKVIYGSAAPGTADRQSQNLWIDTTGNANTPKRWNGSAWVAVTDKVATDAAAAAATALAVAQTKADASAVQSLSNTVEQQGAAITANGAAITNISASLGQVAGENLVYNSSFEKESSTPGVADGWVFDFAGGTRVYSLVNSTVAPGVAQRVDLTGMSSTIWCRLASTSNRRVSVDQGIAYTASMYIRAAAGLQIKPQINGVSSTGAAAGTWQQALIVATGDWQKLSVTFTPLTATVEVQICAVVYGSATVSSGFMEVDQVQVEVGSTATGWRDNGQVNATAIGAVSTTVDGLSSTVSQQGTSLTSVSSRTTVLENKVNSTTDGLATKASTSAVNNLSGRVDATEQSLTSQAQSVTALTASVKAANSAGGNIIPNATFDPAFTRMGFTAVATTASGVPAGCPFKHAAQLSGRDHNPALADVPFVAVKPGDVWRLTALAACGAGTAPFNLYIQIGSDPSTVSRTGTGGGRLTTTSAWTRSTWDYTVPAGVYFIRPFLQIEQAAGAGTVWYATDWHMEDVSAAKAAQATADATATALSSTQTTVTQQGDKLTAETQRIDGLYTSVGNANAAIQNEATARANADSTLSQQIQTTQSSLGDTNASVQQISTAQTGLNNRVNAQFSIKVAVTQSGVYALGGIGVGIQNQNGVLQSVVAVLADRFAVINAAGDGFVSPFAVQGGQVFMNDAFIRDASITNAKIADASISAAKIGVAEVDTLRIRGNAVTVPVSIASPGNVLGGGVGVWKDLIAAGVQMDQAGHIVAMFGCYQGFIAGTRKYQFEMNINGVVIAEGGGDWADGFPNLLGSIAVGPGYHIVTVKWWGEDPTVGVRNHNLFAMGAKR